MSLLKSVLLGSAAGLVTVAGAQAADLPVKAKPVQYVKICSLYGVGFYYIPGTDMCIKVGGWARYEVGYGYNGSFTTEFYNRNVSNRNNSDNNWRVKGTATFDARSPTAYGTVRSYIAIGTSNNNNGDNPISAGYANRWFIQWAGFTIGHSTSFFDFYSIGANQYGFATASSDSGDGGWDVFGYTAQFGNGFSGSIAAEVQRRTRIWVQDFGQQTPQGANTLGQFYQGHDYPDIVANLRVDQAWGSAQIMGALHNVAAQYYSLSETSGHPDDKLGFAVGVGLKLNAPMIGKGDYFQIEADYTQGASRYSNMTAVVWDYSKYDGNSVAFGYQTDATYGGQIAAGTATGLELTTTWAINAAYTHFWNSQWKSTLWGSYYQESYPTLANAIICTGQGFGVGGVGNLSVAAAGCDNDWAAWGVGLRTQWAISSTFYMGLEVLYSNLQSASTPTGTILLAPGLGKPTQLYTIEDQDIWAVRLRVHRDFYP
jgi:Porin subfamily